MSFSWKENLPEELKEKVTKVEKMIQPRIEEIDEQVLYNQQRVLDLFRKHHVGEEDLVPSTGYGYDDIGRDKIEDIYADYFKVDDALVRPQFGSGTHAITVGLFSMLRPGDTLYYLTGTPYDTIQEVIGLAGNKPGNMKEWGINFKTTELTDDGQVDYEKAREDLQDKSIKVVAIQRSLGYATRKTFTMDKIKKMLKFVKEVRPDVNIFIDNCYGEFSECEEPTFYGADMMAGSLYKNAGAGLVKGGAFLVGRQDLIDGAGSRLTVPGAGKGEGALGATYVIFTKASSWHLIQLVKRKRVWSLQLHFWKKWAWKYHLNGAILVVTLCKLLPLVNQIQWLSSVPQFNTTHQ